ncbi:MAG: molybdopterin-dependent oxidoreductase [Chloroflexi bacterium]|nr:molybdopterin-dependent oxidoreductase [Chloroflexota bacterium]
MAEDRPPWHVVCVDGDVQRPLAVSALDLSRFPQREVVAVRAGTALRWQGVDVRWLLTVSGSEPRARFAIFHSGDRHICLPLEQVSKENALLALRAEGRWLAAEEGGPCRLVLQGSRWRDFGGPVDRIQVCVDRPVTVATHLYGSDSPRATAGAA